MFVLQAEREQRLAAKREARIMERQLLRRQEYVRRCRQVIEERRRKVRSVPSTTRLSTFCLRMRMTKGDACMAVIEMPAHL